MREAEAILCDLDQFLVDTAVQWTEANVSAISQHREIEDVTEFRRVFHIKAHEILFQDLDIPMDSDLFETINKKRNEIFDLLMIEQVEWMPGAPEFLDWMQREGKKRAIITNAKMQNFNAMCVRLPELKTAFPVVLTRDVLAPKTKPHPDALLRAAYELGAPPAKCVSTGDRKADMVMSQNAGIPGYLVINEHTEADARDYATGAAYSLKELIAKFG